MLDADLRSGPSPSEPPLARRDHLTREDCQADDKSEQAARFDQLPARGISRVPAFLHNSVQTTITSHYSFLLINVLRSVGQWINILSNTSFTPQTFSPLKNL